MYWILLDWLRILMEMPVETKLDENVLQQLYNPDIVIIFEPKVSQHVLPCGCLYWLNQSFTILPLQWCHNGCDDVLNHQAHHCLLNRLFRRRSKKTSRLRVTGLCAGSSPVTGELPAHMASNAENVSIWQHHHNHLNFLGMDYWTDVGCRQ